MAEHPVEKHVVHPARRNIGPQRRGVARAEQAYAEIQVTTNFTFLTGASHPEEFAERAAALGYRGIAITDVNSLAGAVRMHVMAKQLGLPLAVGCRIRLVTEAGRGVQDVLAYATCRTSYGRLCALLTRGKMRAGKGECHLTLHDLLDFHHGLLVVAIAPDIADGHFLEVIDGLKGSFGSDRLSIAAACAFDGEDRERLRRLRDLSMHVGVPLAATNDAHYHIANRKCVHDVVACIREGTTLERAGFLLKPNAEQHLKTPEEMCRLFAECPGAIERAVEIVERASSGFSLDQLKYEYPHETCPAGVKPMAHLEALTWAGAAKRYGDGRDVSSVPAKVRAQIRHELDLIEELDYPHYFLTVQDIVAFARGRGILCQGRGAAANSAVCFCLEITEVDPNRAQLLFERFISAERDEPPDIDVDFEHERREEVIQYIYAKYGRHRAALTAEVITYRSRSAIREVGKALGLSLDCVDRLAKERQWFDPKGIDGDALRALGLNPDDPTMLRLQYLVSQILGFPRHLSQHVGGFVLTEYALSETVPIENAAMADRTVIEWDKDDIDALGMLKVDCLGLGMLTCVRKCFDLVDQHGGGRYEMYRVPAEDPAVYDMICDADTVGVFQIESRAQMSMLPRLRPRTFYDLVIEVAIVRPGPIQGGMVHPYLKRRTGEEGVSYPSEAVRNVLERTLGVPLFQEQVMALAVAAAGFSPGEADRLRRSMAAWKRKSDVLMSFEEKIVGGMLANGYEREFAERCFKQIMGFGEYGFPESHAASFALIVYVSAWLKCHHPTAFAAALINSQPMGFYAPAQIVRDAQEHGVEARPVDVNRSAWDCTLERDAPGSSLALRLGMRLVKGLKADDGRLIEAAVAGEGAFDDVEALWRQSGVSAAGLKRLASADAFASMGLAREDALWQVRKLRDEPMPLFEHVQTRREGPVALPGVSAAHKVLHDYAATRLSLKAHPMSFLRERVERMGGIEAKGLCECANGQHVAVAGLVLVRQRPLTASGMVFMTLEDETGVANLIVRPEVFERYRRAAAHGHILLARGAVERDSTNGSVVHVMTKHIEDIGREGNPLKAKARNFH